jgi:hypothetical protein
MVEVFPTRRRAEAFARALDGETRAADARLQELLDTAARLAAVPLVQPRAEFRDSLRERLMQAAATELPAQAGARAEPPTPRGGVVVVDDPRAALRRRRMVAVAAGMVLVGGGAGVAAASEQALPGDVLYPVKRTLESAQVTLAQGADAEGRALLERAGSRLAEAEAVNARVLAGDGDVDAVEAALGDFAADASGGGKRLLESYQATGDPADLVALRDFTRHSHEALADLAGTLPPEAQPEVTTADDTVVTLDGLAKRACPDCTVAPPLTALPTQPVSLPDAGGASPEGTLSPDAREADRRPDADGLLDPTLPLLGGGSGGEATAPALPDLRLDGSDRQRQTREQDSSTSGDADGDDAQQAPRLDLGDLLEPTPTAPQRTTDGPALRDAQNLPDPLTQPLEPLLDGTQDTLDGTQDGLDGLF